VGRPPGSGSAGGDRGLPGAAPVCPAVPHQALSQGARRAATAALCPHTAMFRSGGSLSLAARVGKRFLCSLLAFRAGGMLRAPVGLVCVPRAGALGF